MIGAALALALLSQQMTQEDMISEGEQIGRAAAIMGACKATGYEVNLPAGGAWAGAYTKRAMESGWSEQLTTRAIEAGTASERARVMPPEFDRGMSRSQLRKLATDFITRLKASCRQLNDEHRGFIADVDQGDRNADAQLAIMLRGLDS